MAADSALLSGLSPEAVANIRARLERRRYPPGASIVRRGDLCHELFLVESGRVSVTVDLADGTRRRLTTLSEGSLLGELAWIDREPRTADVFADTVVECQVLAADAFDDLLDEDPQTAAGLLRNLLRVVGSTARRLTEDLARLGD